MEKDDVQRRDEMKRYRGREEIGRKGKQGK